MASYQTDSSSRPAAGGQKGDSPHLCEAPSGPYGQMGTVPFLSPAAHAGLGHVVPLWLLAAVFAALVVLTGLTVVVAQVDLGNLNLYLALAIAVVKASLVVMFFMHLFWDRPFNSMVFVGCLLFVTLFIGICLTDSKANQASAIPGQGKEMSGAHTPLGSPAK